MIRISFVNFLFFFFKLNIRWFIHCIDKLITYYVQTYFLLNQLILKNQIITKTQLETISNYNFSLIVFLHSLVKLLNFNINNIIKINLNSFIFLKKINESSVYFFKKIKISFQNKKKKIQINEKFKQFCKLNWKIKFIPTSVNKYTNNNLQNKIIVYYLRKNKIFNKSRYSRNRQLYRTGVYWCLWLSIFIGWGLYFIFYRFTINFGYLWWLTYLGLSSFYFNRLVKYHLYNFKILFHEIILNIIWLKFFIFNFFKTIQFILSYFSNKIKYILIYFSSLK